MDALFLCYRAELFIAHTPRTVKTRPAPRAITKNVRDHLAIVVGKDHNGLGWWTRWRAIFWARGWWFRTIRWRMIGIRRVGKIFARHDNRRCGTLDIARDIGAKVNQVHQRHGLVFPPLSRTIDVPG